MIIILCCFSFEKRTPQENHKGCKHPSHRVLNAKIHPCIHEPRTLDNELRTQVKLGLHNGAFQIAGKQGMVFYNFYNPFCNHPRKGLDPDFDWKKIGFVLEACGKQQEDHVVSAQSSVNNASKTSLQAAYNLFSTNVANDQCLQDKFLATAEMNSSRARSVLVHSLEASRHWNFNRPFYLGIPPKSPTI